MGYRLMAWDGDFRTKDMFRSSGREHANFTQKKAAQEAADRFMRTYPPRSEDARVILEKTSSRWGSTTEAKWGKGPSGWTRTQGDRSRRYEKGVRVTFQKAGKYYGERGTVEHVRKDGWLVVHPDSEPEGALLIVYPTDVSKTSGDARRTKLTRSQQEYVHRKIRILRREHPRWKQKQVVAVAISYARRRGR